MSGMEEFHCIISHHTDIHMEDIACKMEKVTQYFLSGHSLGSPKVSGIEKFH